MKQPAYDTVTLTALFVQCIFDDEDKIVRSTFITMVTSNCEFGAD
jgi:hypothetical protein